MDLVAQNITFFIVAAVILVAAWRVVTTPDIVHAALWLVLVLAGVGVIYLLAAAEFVATTQYLVYIGAIVVLFLFGIMLTRDRLSAIESAPQAQQGVAIGTAVLLAAVMVFALVDSFEDAGLEDGAAALGIDDEQAQPLRAWATCSTIPTPTWWPWPPTSTSTSAMPSRATRSTRTPSARPSTTSTRAPTPR